jgi:hypothetical protein
MMRKTYEITTLDYYVYMAWIDSHLEKKRFSERYKKYLKQHL